MFREQIADLELENKNLRELLYSMNILEIYIEEVISVEEVPHVEWMNQKYLNVKLIANCYGNVKEYERWFGEKEWEQVQKQGYFMG